MRIKICKFLIHQRQNFFFCESILIYIHQLCSLTPNFRDEGRCRQKKKKFKGIIQNSKNT